MGTRSTTHIFDGKISEENHLVSIYKQYDGYISGYGADLSEFLNKMNLVNGYDSTQETGGFANGMGCLSAQLITHFKEGIGGYYITNKNDNQEYDYYIYRDDDKLKIKVIHCDEELFDGTVLDFAQYVIDDANKNLTQS